VVFGSFRGFPHRALAAFAATVRRCSLVMVLRRRFPPTRPPLRPMAAMYAERLEGGTGAADGSGVSLVERSTIHFASWLGSRGRFPLPMVMGSPGTDKADWEGKQYQNKHRNCQQPPNPPISHGSMMPQRGC
jgi:hypothetical protein